MKKILAVLIIPMLLQSYISAQADPIQVSVAYISQHSLSPGAYILSKFESHDILLIGEEHRVKENLEFVQHLIPDLYQHGVYNIGMEFGASEDQATLDSLITAPSYNDTLARKLMFNYNTAWAFKEYMDMYRAAWDFNWSLREGAKKFRIVNLSYRYNWENFSGQRTPENMKAVFSKGNSETYRASVVEREIIQKKEKILILTGDIHAFTKYRYPVYDYTGPDFVRLENGYFGNLLYSKYGDRVFCILLHKPFSNYPNHLPFLLSPAQGAIEKIMALNGNLPVGFDLFNTPPGQLPDSSYYSMGHTDFRLGDLCDGYIFLKPFAQLHGCTLDPMFITDQNWREAALNAPDPDWRPRPKSVAEYWKQIQEYADLQKYYKDIGPSDH